MASKPVVRDPDWLHTLPANSVCVWESASVRGRIAGGTECVRGGTLVAVGGGTLMDEAKYYRARTRPDLGLVLMPSIWGSGAEVSRIVVLNRGCAKDILIGDEFLPDAVIYRPELLETVSPEQARWACSDTWAHALEAFVSPLASESVRGDLAVLIGEMLQLPLATDARWFQASARACALQAQASVGLVHAIAHVLEHPCRQRYPQQKWGHARLCSTFLLPVMNLNREVSPKWNDLARAYGLDQDAIWQVLERLWDRDSFAAVLPLLREHWGKILRDPCARTNGSLVRARHLEELEQRVAA